MPVLSWSLGCQPEYIKPAPPGLRRSGSAPAPPPTTGSSGSLGETATTTSSEGWPEHRQQRRPGTPSYLSNLTRSAEGPQAGEVRARSAAPFEAAHLAQSCLPGYPGPASRKGPTDPTLRANPCPEVTDQDCRFPLPTLIYRLEAPNLGDLMRRLVQSVSKQGLQRTAPAAG